MFVEKAFSTSLKVGTVTSLLIVPTTLLAFLLPVAAPASMTSEAGAVAGSVVQGADHTNS